MCNCNSTPCGCTTVKGQRGPRGLQGVPGIAGENAQVSFGDGPPTTPPDPVTADGIYLDQATDGHYWTWTDGATWVDTGIPLSGGDGTDGRSAFTVTTVGQPIPGDGGFLLLTVVDATDPLTAPDGGNLWPNPGEVIHVENAGYYQFLNPVGSTQMALLNLRDAGTGAYLTNAVADPSPTAIPSGSKVSPGGLQGPPGPTIEVTSGAPAPTVAPTDGASGLYLRTGGHYYTYDGRAGGPWVDTGIDVTGPAGAAGAAGANGHTPLITSVSSNPTGAGGASGDIRLYQPPGNDGIVTFYYNTSGTWNMGPTVKGNRLVGTSMSNPTPNPGGLPANAGDYWVTYITPTYTFWVYDGSTWNAAITFSTSGGGGSSSVGLVDLEADIADGGYEIRWNMGPASNGVCSIGDEFPTGTDAERVDAATAKYPWFIAYCTCDSARSGLAIADRVPNGGAPQWSDADILRVQSISAAMHDAVWKYGGVLPGGWYFGAPPKGRINIRIPAGSFFPNYSLPVVYGKIYGQGCKGGFTSGAGPWPDPQYVEFGTNLTPLHTDWIDDGTGSVGDPNRYVFKSINWPQYIGGIWYSGILGATDGIPGAPGPASPFWVPLYYYMEGSIIEDIHIDGAKADAPEADGAGGNNLVNTYHSSGIAICRAGSGSAINNVIADSFNNASFEFGSGTPVTMYNCRGFHANYASVWMRGEGQIRIFGLEVDDSPTAIMGAEEGFSDENGGYIFTPGLKGGCWGLKIESGTNASMYRKGTMALDSGGWTNFVISGCQMAGVNSYPEGIARCKPFPSGFTSTSSWIKIEGLSVFGYYRTLMHHADGADSIKWTFPGGDYLARYNATIHSFEYNSGVFGAAAGQFVTSTGDAPVALPITYENRQAWLDATGVPAPIPPLWDDVAGTPVYTYTPLP